MEKSHEPEPHLIPNVLSAVLGEQPHVAVFGNTYPTPDGTAICDYVHVTDLAEAHARALEYLGASLIPSASRLRSLVRHGTSTEHRLFCVRALNFGCSNMHVPAMIHCLPDPS